MAFLLGRLVGSVVLVYLVALAVRKLFKLAPWLSAALGTVIAGAIGRLLESDDPLGFLGFYVLGGLVAYYSMRTPPPA